ncbi:MAG: hypothetical protein ACREE6_06695, partial [Limisphaerales bacterium]
MRERPEQILKFVCLGLGLLLFIQFIRIIWTANPLAHVVVPALPSLSDESPSAGSKTNALPAMNPRNNAAKNGKSENAGTNVTASTTNIAARTGPGTNADNRPTARVALSGAARAANGRPVANSGGPTNLPNTNTPRHRRHVRFAGGMSPMSPMGPMGPMGLMPGVKKTTVTPVIQATIDRITDSEILGPVVRPLPMA